MGIAWVGYRCEPAEAVTILDDPERVDELLESEDGARLLDLDKSWHGLHWLLTGSPDPTAAPVSAAICGGEEVGEDLGYGPPRLLSPDAVQSVAVALGAIDVESLKARLDPAAMAQAEVYPAIWDEDDIFDEYLAPSFQDLCDFYAAAAAASEAVIQTLC